MTDTPTPQKDEARHDANEKIANAPTRTKSAKGEPKPTTPIERTCTKCGASFLGLAFGKTGLLGIWHGWHWYCSIECFGPERKSDG